MVKNILLGIAAIFIFILGAILYVISNAFAALPGGAVRGLGSGMTQEEASRLTTYHG